MGGGGGDGDGNGYGYGDCDGDGDGAVADTERLCQNASFTRVVPTREACQSQLTHRQPNLHGHSQHEPLV